MKLAFWILQIYYNLKFNNEHPVNKLITIHNLLKATPFKIEENNKICGIIETPQQKCIFPYDPYTHTMELHKIAKYPPHT